MFTEQGWIDPLTVTVKTTETPVVRKENGIHNIFNRLCCKTFIIKLSLVPFDNDISDNIVLLFQRYHENRLKLYQIN